MRLKDKVIVVTGSTKGIGRGIARVLAREGAKLVVSGRNEKDGAAVVAQLREVSADTCFISADVTIAGDCFRLIDAAVERYGRIDGLVNNAGIFPHLSISETTEEVFDDVMSTNAKGAFFCTQRALAHMSRQQTGAIVNIGSTHWAMGSATLCAYGMSKGALHTLTQHVAHHYAKDHIRANWVTVGWVLSQGEIDRHLADGHDRAWIDDLARQYIPSGTFQTEEDIAMACVYLLSDEAVQVTGTDIQVTGGFKPERI